MALGKNRNVLTNRERRRSAITSREIWCLNCDREMVHSGEKCSYCGWRLNGKTRNKKPYPIADNDDFEYYNDPNNE